MQIKKLDFSEFHPLDHPIWHPYCRNVTNFPESPQGWRNVRTHWQYWRDFMWRDPFGDGFSIKHYLWAIKKLFWY